jgi:hypothetical protein
MHIAAESSWMRRIMENKCQNDLEIIVVGGVKLFQALSKRS